MRQALFQPLRQGALLGSLLLLASCGGPSSGAVETALEQSWSKNTETMAVATGLAGENQPGLARGVQSSARQAVGALRSYAGDRVASLAQDVAGDAAVVADDFGGSTGIDAGLGRALAHDWDVINLEILDQRASGSDYVIRVRYDVYATIAGDRRQIGKDLMQVIRLVYQDGSWMVAR